MYKCPGSTSLGPKPKILQRAFSNLRPLIVFIFFIFFILNPSSSSYLSSPHPHISHPLTPGAFQGPGWSPIFSFQRHPQSESINADLLQSTRKKPIISPASAAQPYQEYILDKLSWKYQARTPAMHACLAEPSSSPHPLISS